MTETDAQNVLLLLKEGMSYKSGHYHYGYHYLSYDKKNKQYIVKKEDLSMNMFEPEISYNYYSDEEMKTYIIKYYKFDEIIEYFRTYYPEQMPNKEKNTSNDKPA